MILVIMGAPGAGKGTQADRIVAGKGFTKLSTGDVFRKHIREKTPLGMKVGELIAAGDLVDDVTTFDLVKAELNDLGKGETVILDGYPRNPNQAEILKKHMEEHKIPLLGVLYLDVERQVVLERISNRRVCKGCGATYHLEYKAPTKEGVCDACGAKVYQRQDDKEENVKHRLDVYRDETEPLLDFFKNSGRLQKIDGGESLDIVEKNISLAISELEKSIA